MIIKRIGHIIMNVITLIHYKLQDLAMRAVDYYNSFKKSLDYLDKPRYISADYDEQDNMEYYSNVSLPRDVFKDTGESTPAISKWDKKSAPYCETP